MASAARPSPYPGTAHAELAAIDDILRAHGFMYPLGARGVQDMADTIQTLRERLDELGRRRRLHMATLPSGQRLLERARVRLSYALANTGHHGAEAQAAECSRIIGRPVSALAELTGPEMLEVIRQQPAGGEQP